MLVNEARSFREVCQKNGIAVTYQRQVLYEVMKTMHGHPSPEEGLCAGEEESAGDLAGYRIQKPTFICGERRLSRSEHASWLRVEMNHESHHHVVCSKCKAIYRHWRKRTRFGVEARQIAWRISGGAVRSGCDWYLCEVPKGIGRFLSKCRGDLWQKT